MMQHELALFSEDAFTKALSLNSKKTPYFYFDKNIFIKNINNYSKKLFRHYYSVKSCLFDGLIKEISKNLDGFTVSSIDSLRKVRAETDKPIHFISPLIRDQEIDAVNSLGNSLTFNSIEQFKKFTSRMDSHIKNFIRINPELSFVKDKRRDTSRPFSHLGIPLSQFRNCFAFDGFHFHNNHQERCSKNILKTMRHIEFHLKDQMCTFQYVNLGGGYIWSKELIKIINMEQSRWKNQYGIKLIIEPGFDISNSAGFLISSVTDLFKSKGKNIAILDVSVNHLPNIFSFQISPEVINHDKANPHSYILAGATCLAGDVFGEYCFKNTLSLGDVVIFKNVGAYSLVKANKFNGIEIPQVYMQ